MRPGRMMCSTRLASAVALSAVVVALGGMPEATLAAEGDTVEGVLLDTEGDEADDLFEDAPSDERIPEDPDEAATQPLPETEELFEEGPLEDASSQVTPSPDIEEIMITATEAEGLLEEEATSVIGYDADELRMEGFTDISDLSGFTPNLQINTAFAASSPTLFIRGIGLDDYNANSASAVAVYQDGVYMNSPVGQLFQLFDVASISVLRGPQARQRNVDYNSGESVEQVTLGMTLEHAVTASHRIEANRGPFVRPGDDGGDRPETILENGHLVLEMPLELHAQLGKRTLKIFVF